MELSNYFYKIVVVVLFSACVSQAGSNRVVEGRQCFEYVDTYLEFHRVMDSGSSLDKISALIGTLYLLPSVVEDPGSVDKLVLAYTEHENEIDVIHEYYASCDPKEKYAVMWFKISDVDSRFSRLYVVIDDGKIRTLSKELESSAANIDLGKEYFELNYE